MIGHALSSVTDGG